MRVLMDYELCENHFVCHGIDPDLFPLDDEGMVDVPEDGVEVPQDKQDNAEQAVANCPTGALRTAE